MIEERLESLIERYTIEIEDEIKNLKKYKDELENVLKESDCLSMVDNSRIGSLQKIVERMAKEDVVSIQLEHTGIGYIHWILNVLAKYFQCETSYAGKINGNDVRFYIFGLRSDIDVCVTVAEGMVYYLNSMLKDIQKCYVGDVDFRIFKKDYCKGFANGLKQNLEQSLIEMNLHPKYELAVVGVPTVVKEWANKKIKVTKSKSRYVTNEEAYKLGNQHGLEYKVKRTDLLEN